MRVWAFVAFAGAPREKVHGMAINVGDNVENFQVKCVADQVKRLIPSASIEQHGPATAPCRSATRIQVRKRRSLTPSC